MVFQVSWVKVIISRKGTNLFLCKVWPLYVHGCWMEQIYKLECDKKKIKDKSLSKFLELLYCTVGFATFLTSLWDKLSQQSNQWLCMRMPYSLTSFYVSMKSKYFKRSLYYNNAFKSQLNDDWNWNDVCLYRALAANCFLNTHSHPQQYEQQHLWFSIHLNPHIIFASQSSSSLTAMDSH